MKPTLMKGNEALAEGAIRGGCRFYAGYPITPQTEILERLCWRMPEVGGTFIQAESELASVYMVFGASGSGARAMTSTSSVGFSLMQEGIAYTLGAELPAVFVNVHRYGNGGSTITQGQDGYSQAVKGGAHGDYHLIVLAPASVQENADMAFEAFTLAEKYRFPVMILSDAAIGQMVEPVVLPEMVETPDLDRFDYFASGRKAGEEPTIVTDTFFRDPAQYPIDHVAKQRKMMEDEQRWEDYMMDDAEIAFVAYGISSRVAREAVDIAREKGIKAGMIRPIRVWPFPRKAFEQAKNVKAYVTMEMNLFGQMREDVNHAVKYQVPTYSYASGRDVPSPEVAVQLLEDILAGKVKEEEVF